MLASCGGAADAAPLASAEVSRASRTRGNVTADAPLQWTCHAATAAWPRLPPWPWKPGLAICKTARWHGTCSALRAHAEVAGGSDGFDGEHWPGEPRRCIMREHASRSAFDRIARRVHGGRGAA